MLSHNKIEEIKAQAYLCVPSNLNNICQVYPFTMKEILSMGQSRYNSLLGLLLLTEVDIANIIKEKTGENAEIEKIYPLSYLLKSAELDDTFLLELQTAFSTFIKEEILLLPKINAVLVGPMEQRRLITNNNFRDFQDILRVQNRKEIIEPPPENESEIARKFRLKREARDAAKKKQQQKKNDGQELSELFEIAEVFGIDVSSKSLYAFYGLIRRYQAKEKWDQDIQMLCAGADSAKIKTKYWGEHPED